MYKKLGLNISKSHNDTEDLDLLREWVSADSPSEGRRDWHWREKENLFKKDTAGVAGVGCLERHRKGKQGLSKHYRRK